jgi:hypothetical protein
MSSRRGVAFVEPLGDVVFSRVCPFPEFEPGCYAENVREMRTFTQRQVRPSRFIAMMISRQRAAPDEAGLRGTDQLPGPPVQPSGWSLGPSGLVAAHFPRRWRLATEPGRRDTAVSWRPAGPKACGRRRRCPACW